MPKLLRMLALDNAIVIDDALNCQRTIARQIVDQRGDYALALKGNQGHCLAMWFCFSPDPELKAEYVGAPC